MISHFFSSFFFFAFSLSLKLFLSCFPTTVTNAALAHIDPGAIRRGLNTKRNSKDMDKYSEFIRRKTRYTNETKWKRRKKYPHSSTSICKPSASLPLFHWCRTNSSNGRCAHLWGCFTHKANSCPPQQRKGSSLMLLLWSYFPTSTMQAHVASCTSASRPCRFIFMRYSFLSLDEIYSHSSSHSVVDNKMTAT